ncbi:hypothetical protein [Sporosarcina sp. G11-34]|nr:hypothetical protein [Sporosarcina sp. G11-34]
MKIIDHKLIERLKRLVTAILLLASFFGSVVIIIAAFVFAALEDLECQ